METTAIKYTIIKSRSQYDHYCYQLERLLTREDSESSQDEIDLLTLLIEKFDEEKNTFKESDPITALTN